MSTVAIWIASNGLGALAFVVLCLYLLFRGGLEADNRMLLVACAINGFWCALFALIPVLGLSGPTLDLSETLRDGAWLTMIASLLPRARAGRAAPVLRYGALALPLLFALAILAHALSIPMLAPDQPRSLLFAVGAIAMTLWGLVMLEQIYRSADMENRWQAKYLCLALAVLLAYDFLMYSYILLNPKVNISVWDARGAVNAMMAPLIAISAARRSASGTRLRLSHQAAFHTTAILLSGLYLLVIALAGFYTRNFGGSWGEVFEVLLIVAMLVVLVVLTASGRVRSMSKVFVKKHFLQYKYDYRAEWLALTRQLSRSEDIADPYQRSICAVAGILDSPAGALWIAREKTYVCAAHWNMAAAVETIKADDSAFIGFLRQRGWIVDLDEYIRDPAHYGRVRLPAWLSDMPRARLLIPLLVEHTLLGFMLLSAPRAAQALSWEDLDLLKTVGRQVGSFLGQQENHQALAQARQFEAFNRLTAFLMHDLKNIAQQQSLIVQNAKKHRHNPAFIDDMVLTVESSVARMKRLLDQLQRTGAGNEQGRRVAVRELVAAVVAELKEHSQPLIFASGQRRRRCTSIPSASRWCSDTSSAMLKTPGALV